MSRVHPDHSEMQGTTRPPAEPPTRLPNRIPSLDGLRGISIWAVMAVHAADHWLFPRYPSRHLRTLLSDGATLGVTIFFVISGFLITTILLTERSRTGGIHVRRFYRKRAVRILPAFAVFTALILLLFRPGLRETLYALTFTTSFFFWKAFRPLQHLWSLSVEEQFYLAWPLIFSRGVADAKRWCWIVLIACPLLRTFFALQGWTHLDHAAVLDSIAAGCLLAFYREQIRSATAWIARSPLLFGGSLLLLPAFSLGLHKAAYRFWELTPLTTLVPLLIAVVVGVAIDRQDTFLNKGPLVWCGLISYALYLWQQPFLVLHGPFDFFLVRIACTFALAYASYRWLEQPIIHYFAQRDRRERPTMVSQSA